MYARIAAAALLCMTALPASSANRGSTVMEDYAAALNARGQILQLDTGDMFGERIGLFTGSVEFLQTDVDLPGNSALEVGIKRRLVAGAQGRQGLGMFGVWDLALPRVHGTFSTQGGMEELRGGRAAQPLFEVHPASNRDRHGEGTDADR